MSRITDFAVRVSKRIIKYDELVEENKSLKSLQESQTQQKNWGWPNGHFYSPVHSPEDLSSYEEVVKRSKEGFKDSIPGFSEKEMIRRFKKLKSYFKDFDYPEEEDGESRFYIKNCSYPITDALILFSMIRNLKPKRIIEVGSGYTSALMMDVNERFFNNKIEITFVEPYPELLLSRMNEKDRKRYRIIPKGVQEVPVEEFSILEKGDILFIDSTHVSKFNSDVNYELFNILPNLEAGVTIHFHDVFDGFEYPLQWLKDGWAWNEDYLLRAFLNENNSYEVVMMNDYLTNRYGDLLHKSFSRVSNDNGGSLWIKKIK
jgi:hypothetical protein